MRYVSFTLITLWSAWLLLTKGNLKPSENYFLWILGVLSFMYSAVNIVIFYIDSKSKKQPLNQNKMGKNKMKIRRKLEFFYVWFKYVFLKVKLPLRSIELVEKHFKATKSEKKLIEKLKKINSKQE